MAELIQQSPACSRRAQLVTETGKEEKKDENTDFQKQSVAGTKRVAN